MIAALILAVEFSAMPLVNGIPANYVQSPSPVLLEDGTIVMVLDWGSCCRSMEDPYGGEIIGTLTLPKYGAPIYSQKFSTYGWPGAHEAAYPSMLWVDDRWVIVYSSTTTEEGETIGVGVVELSPAFQPIRVRHRHIVNGRNHWSPVLIQYQGDLYIYASDETRADNAIVRYRVDRKNLYVLDETIIKSPGELYNFPLHKSITDIAVFDGNHLVGLLGQNCAGEKVWVIESYDGIVWSLVLDLGVENKWVFDAGILKTRDGLMVRPPMIWANAVNGPNGCREFPGWSLVRWDFGYELPATADCACAAIEPVCAVRRRLGGIR